jgi:hypothetical protein
MSATITLPPPAIALSDDDIWVELTTDQIVTDASYMTIDVAGYYLAGWFAYLHRAYITAARWP